MTIRRSRSANVLLVALATAAPLACGGRATQSQQAPPVPVTVGHAERTTVPLTLRAIGHVEPISTVAVRARIGGELLRVGFREGQRVASGAELFVIDPRPFEAAVKQAEAQLARNQALRRKAEADVARYAGLVRQDFITKEQYDQMVATAQALEAAEAADRASIENARLQLSYCTIASPVAGRTGNLNLQPGNLVKANDEQPLVTIKQTQPIYVAFSVPAQFLPQIKGNGGKRVSVTASLPEGGGSHQGTLSFVDNAVDAATSTILLKATFPNREETLWPGQFVEVLVSFGDQADRVVVPTPAVQTGQQGQYVFVVRPDQTVEMRTVTVERMDERQAVIGAGLEGGETVVTDGHLRLTPNARVEPKAGREAAAEKRP